MPIFCDMRWCDDHRAYALRQAEPSAKQLIYEEYRPSTSLSRDGSYRTLCTRLSEVVGVEDKIEEKARVFAQVIVGLPEDYVVEEMAWDARMTLGELQWWVLIGMQLYALHIFEVDRMPDLAQTDLQQYSFIPASNALCEREPVYQHGSYMTSNLHGEAKFWRSQSLGSAWQPGTEVTPSLAGKPHRRGDTEGAYKLYPRFHLPPISTKPSGSRVPAQATE